MRFGVMAAAVLLVSANVACGDDAPTGNGVNNTQITVADNYFSPTNATGKVGEQVIWIWGGSIGHNVIFTTGGAPADCAVQSSGFCFRTFTAAGTYNFVCSLHAGMNGSITIQ